MPMSEQQSDFDKLRAFEMRMQTEGAAGFANGLEPWTHWQEPAEADSKRAWGCDREHEDAPTGKTLCEKILSTMATLAVATLAVGIGGVYLSAQSVPPLAQDGSQPPDTVATADPAPAPADTGSVIQPTAELAATTTSDTITIVQAPRPARTATDTPVESLEKPAADMPLVATNEIPVMQQQAANMAAPPSMSAMISTADITAGLPAPAAGSVGTDASSIDAMPAPAAAPVSSDTDPGKPSSNPHAAKIAREKPMAISMAASPVEPSPAAVKAAVEATGTGPWVVNISSYTYESMARRKLQEFRDKGVVAEVFPVTIKGKPMYRIRATGYDSRKEAKTWLSLLQDRLDVDSAWVSKR